MRFFSRHQLTDAAEKTRAEYWTVIWQTACNLKLRPRGADKKCKRQIHTRRIHTRQIHISEVDNASTSGSLKKKRGKCRTFSRSTCPRSTEGLIDTWAMLPMLRMRCRTHSCPLVGIWTNSRANR